VKRPDRVSVPLVAIDADATASPEQREAGSALAWLSADGREDDVTDLVLAARSDLVVRVQEALGTPAGEMAEVMADLAVRHVVRGLTPEAVTDLLRSHPELVLEAKRHVERAEADFAQKRREA
jgi:hypothetical protein